ncbi:MAG: fibronectin/fibrinogen-binding protein [Anaerolineae bacterium]|nr:fibronectin/fibrinogen-binding protein [Anaerolineae bacterium]
MHLDSLSLACWKEETSRSLLPARVQNILHVDPLSFGFELYAGQRYNLLLSADAARPRAVVVPYKLRRGVDAPHPLLLQLRKHLEGARLVGISQPPWERILNFHFETPGARFTLVAEMMGRYSNLVLLDETGTVLEAAKRISLRLNRQRSILPGHPYQLPPLPAGREAPTAVDCAALLSRQNPRQDLAALLSQHVLAVSPTLGREIQHRLEQRGEITPHALRACLDEFFSTSAVFAPALGYDAQNHLTAFAAYPLTHCTRTEPAASLNDALLEYLSHGQAVDAYARARGSVEAHLAAAIGKTEHRAAQMRAQQADPAVIDRLREDGELLLAYQHLVQRGMDSVTVPDYEGNPREIRVEPRVKASENAAHYFQRYEKAKRAAAEMPRRVAKVEAELACLRQLAADLAIATTRPQIDAVYNALAEGGYIRTRAKRPRVQESAPLRFAVAGFTVWVGRSARQNEQVSFKLASPEDTWLHVHDSPGAHVIIQSGGQALPAEVLQFAMQAAAYYSPLRLQGGGAQVDCTLRKYVRRVPGGHPGLVTYSESTSLWVADAAKEPVIAPQP